MKNEILDYFNSICEGLGAESWLDTKMFLTKN
jgi:hypothetical protein